MIQCSQSTPYSQPIRPDQKPILGIELDPTLAGNEDNNNVFRRTFPGNPRQGGLTLMTCRQNKWRLQHVKLAVVNFVPQNNGLLSRSMRRATMP